jgi:hypothetical protein
MNTLNKLPLGMDFTAGGLNQLSNHPLRIYSAHVLQCMNVNNECFDICNTGVPEKRLDNSSFIFKNILQHFLVKGTATLLSTVPHTNFQNM